MSDANRYYSVDTLVENTSSEEVKLRYFELKLEDEKRLSDELTTLVKERDAAEGSISEAYRIVTGSYPEWSNLFGFKEALQDIESRVSHLNQERDEMKSQVERLTGERDQAKGEIAKVNKFREDLRHKFNQCKDERDQAVAACEVMREALDKCDCWCRTSEGGTNKCDRCKALEIVTHHDNSLIERLKEAVELLGETKAEVYCISDDSENGWKSRRDTWLKGTP